MSTFAPLLEAAGRYVLDFQDRFRNVVAEETYRQWTADEVKTLRSDVVFDAPSRSAARSGWSRQRANAGEVVPEVGIEPTRGVSPSGF